MEAHWQEEALRAELFPHRAGWGLGACVSDSRSSVVSPSNTESDSLP